MSHNPNDFNPDDFCSEHGWVVYTGNAGAGDFLFFEKVDDNIYNLHVGTVAVEGLVFDERTRTLNLPDGTRSISFWEGSPIHWTGNRIFGARKGVAQDDLLPFEKTGAKTDGDGAWGAEEGGG